MVPPPSTPSRRPPRPFENAAATPSGLPPEPPTDALLVEIAWEVCNKVGGIYQVVRSKAPLMANRWHDRYCLIGPYIERKAQLEFEPAPTNEFFSRIVAALEREGVIAHHGLWLIPGRPRVLLLEHRRLADGIGRFRQALAHELHTDVRDESVVDEAILFGEAVQRALGVMADALGAGRAGLAELPLKRLIAHFHEWQGAVALPFLRRRNPDVATVFTTHATQVGRYIASSESDFYDKLSQIDSDAAAAHYNVRAQHGVERACARDAHVFTTVSPITAEECFALLGREPDLITPNGLDVSRFNVGHDFQTFHADFKQRLHTFTMGYFFPYSRFDLDRTLYMFTSGRFEPHNKGFDLCLEAMSRLNAQLKLLRLNVTIVFFIIASRPTRSIHPLVLEKRGVLNELRDVCENVLDRVGDGLFQRAACGDALELDDLVEEYWQLRYRRTQAAFRMNTPPPIVTHILEDDQTDPVLVQLRALKLFNQADDPVKIVYHPEFLSPVSPLWGVEYEQFVRGCHLGLFPSAYEPWGYTPLECMALGTPAISSDLAGFGRYVEETLPDHDQWGVWVLSRRGRTFSDAADDLARRVYEYCTFTRRHRVALRNEVEKRSWDFDWARLGVAYHRAHDLALERS